MMMESKVLGILSCQLSVLSCQFPAPWWISLREALLEEVACDGVENSVEEVDGLGGGVAAADFEGFVDDDGGWGVGVADHLGDGGADEVAVDDGHALDAPVLGVGFDEGVDLFLPVEGDAMEVFGEASGVGVDLFDRGPEEFADFFGGLFAEVSLEEHLHGEFAGLAACAHYLELPELFGVNEEDPGLKPSFSEAVFRGLKPPSNPERRAEESPERRAEESTAPAASFLWRETISIAAVAASKPLLPALRPARSRACSRVSQVRTPKAWGTPVSCWDWPMPRATSL